jgi:hypothetical protein
VEAGFRKKIMRQQKHDPEKWEPVFQKDHASKKARELSRFNLTR